MRTTAQGDGFVAHSSCRVQAEWPSQLQEEPLEIHPSGKFLMKKSQLKMAYLKGQELLFLQAKAKTDSSKYIWVIFLFQMFT